jgi:hypothetical protein
MRLRSYTSRRADAGPAREWRVDGSAAVSAALRAVSAPVARVAVAARSARTAARPAPGRRGNVPGRAHQSCAGRFTADAALIRSRRACPLVPALPLTAVGEGSGADHGARSTRSAARDARLRRGDHRRRPGQWRPGSRSGSPAAWRRGSRPTRWCSTPAEPSWTPAPRRNSANRSSASCWPETAAERDRALRSVHDRFEQAFRGFDRDRYPVWRDWLGGAGAYPRRAPVIARMRQAGVPDLPGALVTGCGRVPVVAVPVEPAGLRLRSAASPARPTR